MQDKSALLKHELAYCLGQMRDAAAVEVLIELLNDSNQEPIVRHEAGEALAAIGLPAAILALKENLHSAIPEVSFGKNSLQLKFCDFFKNLFENFTESED